MLHHAPRHTGRQVVQARLTWIRPRLPGTHTHRSDSATRITYRPPTEHRMRVQYYRCPLGPWTDTTQYHHDDAASVKGHRHTLCRRVLRDDSATPRMSGHCRCRRRPIAHRHRLACTSTVLLFQPFSGCSSTTHRRSAYADPSAHFKLPRGMHAPQVPAAGRNLTGCRSSRYRRCTLHC